MAFDWSELGLDRAPRGFLESTLFRVLDIGQTNEPSLGRQQQTGPFLPRRETQDDAPDHTLGIVVSPTPPDLPLGADLERTVDEAVLEIFDPRQIGKPSAVSNRDAHAGRILAASSNPERPCLLVSGAFF